MCWYAGPGVASRDVWRAPDGSLQTYTIFPGQSVYSGSCTYSSFIGCKSMWILDGEYRAVTLIYFRTQGQTADIITKTLWFIGNVVWVNIRRGQDWLRRTTVGFNVDNVWSFRPIRVYWLFFCGDFVWPRIAEKVVHHHNYNKWEF